MPIETRLVSSLEKIFPRPQCSAKAIATLAAPGGETAAFQLAVKSTSNLRFHLDVESPIKDCIRLREVKLVPCEYPANYEDDFIITAEPGLFPDPLVPLDPKFLHVTANNWYAFWISVDVPLDFTPGTYDITLVLSAALPPEVPWPGPGFEPVRTTLKFTVLPFNLPKQTLININWFYADCIAKFYNLTPWSEPFWKLLAAYFKNMARHGHNVLYTPLWTPPLDTGLNCERPTTQLLDITEKNGQYSFDFSNLRRWIQTAREAGLELFELSHMFTQWGAKATPKIIVNGTRKFGWDMPAQGDDYKNFLNQLLPQLVEFLREQKLQQKCFFHISDEPTMAVIESYKQASALIRSYVDDDEFPIIDALSEVEFYRLGLIERPIPVTETVETFPADELKQRWVYYCGNWKNHLPNRQFGMPSIRSRVMGLMLYLYKMEGFLHWGFNFWYTQLSLDQDLNPWQCTDSGRAHAGGASYNVYPGPDGPIDAMHYETFTEGLQDLRALQLLEQKIGRDKVVDIIQKGVDYTIDLRNYPHEAEWLLELRQRINQAIVNA